MKASSLLIVLAVLVAGCAASSSPQTQSVFETSACPPEYTNAEPIDAGDTVTYKICSRSFAFEPSILKAKTGQKVVIDTYVPDIPHAFVISEFDVNERLPSGKKVFEFTPTKSGEFSILCTVPGHKEAGMVGKLVVE